MENLFSFVDDSDEQKGQIMTLPFLLCHSKNKPPALQVEGKSLD